MKNFFQTTKFSNISYTSVLKTLSKEPSNYCTFADDFSIESALEQSFISKEFYVFKDSIRNFPRCLYFQKNHYFRDLFDKHLRYLQEGGVIQKFLKQSRLRKNFKGYQEPTQLTFKDYKKFLGILSQGLISCGVVFLFEILWFRLKRWKN